MSALDDPQPTAAEPLAASLDWRDPAHEPLGGTPTPWTEARAGLAAGGTYWLATRSSEGRPHLVPLLAVLVDGAVHLCANETSRKARNLAADPRCTVATSGLPLDLVIEGRAAHVTDHATLERVAVVYRNTYGWDPEVRDGALWADGAPTAGPPPYGVYRIDAETAFGFPTDEATTPTRWRSGPPPAR